MQKLAFLAFLATFAALVAASETKDLVRQKRGLGAHIIGGEPVLAGEFKFVAAITVQTSSGRFFCGGALISNEWILTAGQCVYDATLFTIKLGSNLLEGDNTNRLTLATSEYVIYPDFNSSTLEHDVGLIRLRVPIEFTAHELNKVYVSSITNLKCQLTFGSQVTDDMVCINGNYNEGACIGDTGSPLIQIVSRGRQLHVGISTFISGNGCQTIDPSGYTRTYSYIEWIRNTSDVWEL